MNEFLPDLDGLRGLHAIAVQGEVIPAEDLVLMQGVAAEINNMEGDGFINVHEAPDPSRGFDGAPVGEGRVRIVITGNWVGQPGKDLSPFWLGVQQARADRIAQQ